MEIETKIQILKSLDTKTLLAKLKQYEDEFLKALTEESDFKSQNRDYLGTGDCQKVKEILALLAVKAPETNEAGKKSTVADKEAWLIKQRTEDKELLDAITRQRQVAFLVDDHAIKVEMAKRRLSGATAVLALKTAQIRFLSEN